jgi:hypothetical protein
MAMPGRFSRLVVMNTTLGSGDYQLSEGFLAWRDWARKNPDMRPAKAPQVDLSPSLGG